MRDQKGKRIYEIIILLSKSNLLHLIFTYQNDESSRLSIVEAAAIRIPSQFMMIARSMPLSSARNIFKKSPTLCVMGRNANWHFSARLGNGTITWGRPRIYWTVTSPIRQQYNQKPSYFICIFY